jgi:hypothetical protein
MCGSGRDEEPSGGEALRLIQIRLATLNFEKISLARQGNLPQMQTATSSSTNAGNFSSGAQRNASIAAKRVSNRDCPRGFFTVRRFAQMCFRN